VTIAPVNDVSDLLGFDHLAERDAWAPIPLPDGRTVRGVGRFASATRTPPTLRRPSPRLDEHGSELRAEIAAGPRAPRPAPTPDGPETLPFAGLKVADLTWVVAGPATTRTLVDHGALVVRVESESKPCATRLVGPYADGKPGLNRSHFFGDYNAAKRGIALNLKTPQGVDIVRRLIAWADVYIENFRPGIVDKLGLGYEVAREINPSIVMLSTSLMGSRGPASHLAGYGYHAGAIAGYYEVTGWPDRPPDGPWLAYTDTVAPRFQVTALMAALDHRRRTGEGQLIEFAQLEAALQFLAPEILAVEAGGAVPRRRGNRAVDAAPQGAYPCAGDDQWCSIAVESDLQWQALCRALGDPDWARAEALDDSSGRLARHDEIDAHLAEWTRTRDARKVMETLVAAGVPAGEVADPRAASRHPQMAARGFFEPFEHPVVGRHPAPGLPFRYTTVERWLRAPAPTLGQHNREILGELLGLDDAALEELEREGVIGTRPARG
jgi:crotonobetainyl-CoA:carnitine CoA-transferase CaiB-like acyl-CoA transferase